MSLSTLALAVSLALPGADAPSKFDWPQWRGQNRDGISPETGLLRQWPKDGPTVAWKVSGLGGGYSTPSVAAGRIFGMGYQGDDEVVWALSEKDGSKLWTTKIAAKGRAGHNEGPRSTPTVDGDRVYCVGISGDLICLTAEKGEIVWQKNYKTAFKGRMMSGWGFSESVLIDGDHLICTPGADATTIACLDKKDGKVVWTSEVANAGGAGYSSIMKAQVGKTKMYVTVLGKSGGVVAVNAKDGNFLWRYTKIANVTANIPTVLVRDDIIFCSTGYGAGAAVLRLVETSSGGVNAEEVNFMPGKEVQNHHGGMVLVGDHVYLGRGHNDGKPTCVEFKTGKTAWAEDRGPGSGSAAVAYADGMLYFRYQNGTMALIEANPKEYKLVSSFKLPEQSGRPSWPHPVIANGKLYVRDQDKLICFDVKATQ